MREDLESVFDQLPKYASSLALQPWVGLGMVSTGAGFPMHLDLDMVHCVSPMEFQISRHTLSAPVLCTAYLPKNSGIQL
jgi:hypothetical protein